MSKIRLAIIGVGNIGNMHLGYFMENEVNGAIVTAVCDLNQEKLASVKARFQEKLTYYHDPAMVFADPTIDAVLIATPHYDHPVLAIEALKAGKHVLIEKPTGVYTKKVREMIAVAQEHPELTLAVMFNQRTNPLYQKMRDMVQSGELGELRRTNWIITTWYRAQSYYDSGGWRATWKGEGGGVLLNQDPHQLDLWQWICGMPEMVHGFAFFGKHRDIEVEDEVTAYVEYPNGATGVFVTSVSECPGTNRFEVVGSKGKLVVEDGKLYHWQLETDERTFNQTYTGGFGAPEVEEMIVPVHFDSTNEHRKMTQNFIDHIIDGVPLLAPATEGMNGLLISNAIYLSAWKKAGVPIPFDEDEFLTYLQQKIATSVTKQVADVTLNTEGTYL